MIERRLVDARPLLGIDRLHQVDLDGEGTGAGLRDVLVDVLALAPELAAPREPEQVDPEPPQRRLVGAPTAICCTPRTAKGRADKQDLARQRA